jgi:hypothetical protein
MSCKPFHIGHRGALQTRQEEEMIRHIYFSHYRGIREVITATVTVGAATLLSYFILLAGA